MTQSHRWACRRRVRERLTGAEEELARLNAASRESCSATVHDGNAIRARIKAMAAELQRALSADVSVARDVLSKKLGDIVVEERDDGIYAQMDIGPVLLRAAGADVSKSGCGGPQHVLATPANQELSGTISVRLGDRMTRRRAITD